MSSKLPKPPYRVQIICETALEYFRNIKLSVRHYGFTTGRMELVDNWYADTIYDPASTAALYPYPHRRHQAPLSLDLAETVRKNRIDGIIAQIKEKEMADALLKLSIPVVEIGNRFTPPPFTVVAQDSILVGQQAAEHLLNCGGAAFGFWGQRNALYSDVLKKSFKESLRRNLQHASIFEMDGESIINESGTPLIQRMSRWLKKLPTPLGIFTVADTFGIHLMQAAQSIGLRVPEDVAVLSSGNDAYWVDFGNIPLSSIHYNPKGIGFEAAALLDRMMTQGVRTAPNRYVSGSEVFPRRSTDVLFVEDQAVFKAVAFIRKHANKNIYVGDVVKASGVSRTGLHLRFKNTLGRSVLDEIRNARIRHVQMLLRTTSLQLTEIAEACDFPDTPALHVMFRKVTGKTPAKYRAMFRQL